MGCFPGERWLLGASRRERSDLGEYLIPSNNATEIERRY
jgi:hypothetical protein